ncbi:MAG: NADH-quinone oxidoreductase subunit C [Myxococcota bacterium]
MSRDVLDQLVQRFDDAVLATHDQFGDETALITADVWHEAAVFLRDDLVCSMDHFIDLTAVDFADRRTPRFEVVLHLRSSERLHRIRLKAPVGLGPGGENPQVDSLVDVWKGANWFERECYDMFGVEFVGHPDLRRILMYEQFEGHPLRKDYDAHRTQPLVPYREGYEKLQPFGLPQGMPFGRQTHDRWKTAVAGRPEDAGATNLLGFEED